MGKKIQNKKNNVFTFQVMGLTYKVVEVDKNGRSDFFLENGSPKLYGLCDEIAQTIYLLKEMPKERKRRTLMHEITHVIIDNIYACDNTTDTKNFNDKFVCEFISLYSKDIYDISKKYILGKWDAQSKIDVANNLHIK